DPARARAPPGGPGGRELPLLRPRGRLEAIVRAIAAAGSHRPSDARLWGADRDPGNRRHPRREPILPGGARPGPAHGRRGRLTAMATFAWSEKPLFRDVGALLAFQRS